MHYKHLHLNHRKVEAKLRYFIGSQRMRLPPRLDDGVNCASPRASATSKPIDRNVSASSAALNGKG